MIYLNFYENVPFVIEGEEKPCLEYYPAKNKAGHGTVLIFPGGSYVMRAKHEGAGYAEFFNSIGLDAFVLQYRNSPYRHPVPLFDARHAIKYIRFNADKFGVNPNKIAVMGSSAGGHLAALLSTSKEVIEGEDIYSINGVSYRPDYQILCYPVTSRESHDYSYLCLFADRKLELTSTVDPIVLADADTPPAFIWHTSTDTVVDPRESLKYASKLISLGIKCDLHLYADGGHGLGLAENYPTVSSWTHELEKWLKFNGFFE